MVATSVHISEPNVGKLCHAVGLTFVQPVKESYRFVRKGVQFEMKTPILVHTLLYGIWTRHVLRNLNIKS